MGVLDQRRPQILAREIDDRPPRIAGDEADEIGDCGGETLNLKFTVQEEGGNVCTGQEVTKVIVGPLELLDLRLELGVHRGQFLVQRLQFLVRGFQFLVGRLQLLV